MMHCLGAAFCNTTPQLERRSASWCTICNSCQYHHSESDASHVLHYVLPSSLSEDFHKYWENLLLIRSLEILKCWEKIWKFANISHCYCLSNLLHSHCANLQHTTPQTIYRSRNHTEQRIRKTVSLPSDKRTDWHAPCARWGRTLSQHASGTRCPPLPWRAAARISASARPCAPQLDTATTSEVALQTLSECVGVVCLWTLICGGTFAHNDHMKLAIHANWVKGASARVSKTLMLTHISLNL